MRFETTSRLIFAFVLAVIAVAAGAPALAQKPEERRWCDGEDAATPDQRITGCSAVIRAGRDRSEKLAEAFNNRGLAYRLKGDLERAIQDYGQAIRIHAKFADAHNNRGVAYDKRGDYDRAILDYDQSIKLKPSAEAHFNRGNAHLGKSEYAAAIDDYNQAIRLQADFAPALGNRCWARAVVGILRQALADCNEALRLMPNNAATLDSRAFVFLKMTNFDAAVSDFDRALRIDPRVAFTLYGRGVARLRNNDPAGETDVAEARAIQADIAEEYARYGMSDVRRDQAGQASRAD